MPHFPKSESTSAGAIHIKVSLLHIVTLYQYHAVLLHILGNITNHRFTVYVYVQCKGINPVPVFQLLVANYFFVAIEIQNFFQNKKFAMMLLLLKFNVPVMLPTIASSLSLGLLLAASSSTRGACEDATVDFTGGNFVFTSPRETAWNRLKQATKLWNYIEQCKQSRYGTLIYPSPGVTSLSPLSSNGRMMHWLTQDFMWHGSHQNLHHS